MPNFNTATGIRFGVIAFNSLAGWAYDDLWYGPTARDLSYEEALTGLKAGAEATWDKQLELAEIAAAETDPHMTEGERQRFIDEYMAKALDYDDKENFLDSYLEKHSEDIQIDEPVIEGEYDGVKYRISWLGGAPLLWVFEGPTGRATSLCSPCVPGAADLDSGFVLDTEYDLSPEHAEAWRQGYECYCVPRQWLGSSED